MPVAAATSLDHVRTAATTRRLLVVAGLLAAAWVLLGMLTGHAHAAPAAPTAITISQPDGSRFTARQFGDEWANAVETLDGYTVVRGDQNFFEYAVKRDGKLMASGRRVSRDSPAGLTKHSRADATLRPPGAPGVGLAPAQSSPHTGPAQTLVILARFTDQAPQTTAASWATSFFGSSGSVKDYFDKASYGALQITAATESSGTANDGIVGWLSLNRIHPNTGAATGAANRILARDAIVAADPFVDYASYDTDGDGYLSSRELHITVIAAGYEGATCSTCSKSVWGHAWVLNSAEAPSVDGVFVGYDTGRLGGYTQFGELHSDGATAWMATIGIMVHEMGHDLRLPDLYDTDLSTQGVGNWSVMGTGSWGATGTNRGGTSPAFFDPFSRIYEGWTSPQRLTGTQTGVSIPQAETSNTVYQLGDNPAGVDWTFSQSAAEGYGSAGSGEYFLVENRQQTGYDAALPGCGLVIWHIDETRPGTNAANADETRRLVDVVEADGGMGTGRGDAGDPFPGSTSKLSLTGATTPNTNWYDGSASGITVRNISPSCASTMSADFVTADSAVGNDQFLDALAAPSIPWVAGWIHTGEAGLQPGETHPGGCTSMSKTVWFKYTAPVDMQLTATTAGSYFDTLLVAYDGTALPSLVSKGCDDNGGGGTSAKLTISAQAGHTYHFQVGGKDGAGDWLYFQLKGLTNDQFASAVQISSLPYAPGTIDTADATIEAGEFVSSGCTGMGRTIWFKYTPTSDIYLRANTAGSTYDTVLSAYRGTTLASLTHEACDNDGIGNQSQVEFRALGGQTYYFQVGGFSGAGGELEFALSGEEIASNDDFGDATTITSAGVNESVSTSTAGLQSGEFTPAGCPGPGKTVWYKVTPTTDSWLTLSTQFSGFDTTMNVWRGTTLAGLVKEACNNDVSADETWSQLEFLATAGQTYYVQVGGFNGQHGWLYMSATVEAVPAHDHLVNARPTTSPDSGYYRYYQDYLSTKRASVQAPDPVPSGCPTPTNTVWYRHTATRDEQLKVSTQYSDFDTVLTAYRGTTAGALTQLGCSDDQQTPERWSQLTLRVKQGDVVSFQVGGFNGAFGNLNFWIEALEIPVHDDLADAKVMTDYVSDYGNITTASLEAGEPVPAAGCPVPARSVWYKVAPDSPQWVTATTQYATNGVTLAVYKGSSLGTLTPVGCTAPYDEEQPTADVQWRVDPGDTYYVQVGALGSVSDPFMSISIAPTAIPPNDTFAAAKPMVFDDGYFSDYANAEHTGTEATEPTPSGCPAAPGTTWWKYVPTEDITLTVGTYGNGPTSLTVWRGTALSSLTQLACTTFDPEVLSNPEASVVAKAGSTYYVQVGQSSGAPGYVSLYAATSPAPPVNDAIADATVIAALPYTGGAENQEAGSAGDPLSCAPVGRTAWWRWTAPTTGLVAVDTQGSNFDTVLHVYTGSTSALTSVGCNDDSGPLSTSRVNVSAVAGQTYWIKAGGFAGAHGALVLHVANVPSHTLNILFAGDGAGSVYDSVGLECTSTCSPSYATGSTVTLGADPAEGSTFTGWSGACTGKELCEITLDANKSATATFALDSVVLEQLSVSKLGTGTGTVTSDVGEIACGAACATELPHGTDVALTATPAASSTFTGWSGACTGTTACVVTMDGTRSATATFTLKSYPLTVTKVGTGAGTVTSSPGGVSCGTVCAPSFGHGTSVTLTPAPTAGSTFGGWTGACTGTGGCLVPMTSAKAVSARFTDIPPTATVTGPLGPTSPIVVAFSQVVRGVTATNLSLTLSGSTAQIARTTVCYGATNAVVSCATGDVRSARMTATAALTPGRGYVVKVNPAGVATPIKDLQMSAVTAATIAVRALTVEAEALPSAYAWGSVTATGPAGGSYTTERIAGASATFAFTGTAIKWYTMTGPGQGKADVYVDGVKKTATPVNNYSATTVYRVARAYSGLTNAAHKVEIRVLGQNGTTATGAGSAVAVDAFAVNTTTCPATGTVTGCTPTPAPLYRWGTKATAAAGAVPAHTAATSDQLGATMTLSFYGTGVDITRVLGPDQGKMDVYVDGVKRTTTPLDNYAATRTTLGAAIYRVSGLTNALHSVKITVLRARRTGATGYFVSMDRWKVL